MCCISYVGPAYGGCYLWHPARPGANAQGQSAGSCTKHLLWAVYNMCGWFNPVCHVLGQPTTELPVHIAPEPGMRYMLPVAWAGPSTTKRLGVHGMGCMQCPRPTLCTSYYPGSRPYTMGSMCPMSALGPGTCCVQARPNASGTLLGISLGVADRLTKIHLPGETPAQCLENSLGRLLRKKRE